MAVALAQDTSTIHVYRPSHVVGKLLKPSIYYDGIELQRLHNGTFFVTDVPSGKHMITSGRSEVGLLVDLQPGQHYYFRAGHRNIWRRTLDMGVQWAILTQVSRDEALLEMEGLHQKPVKAQTLPREYGESK